MAQPPEPDDVDDDVFVEGGPVLRRDVAHVDDGLGVVGVDVEDGSVDHASHVSAVPRRPREPGVSGETDLVDNGRMPG